MTYEATLAYLFEQLPMFHRIGPAAYKANLNNTHTIMELLDHPEKDFRCVHIAGTNGKGSTSHMLASILQQSGYKTGLYTSPHLKDFRERIKVNGKMIEKSEVVKFVKKYKKEFAMGIIYDHGIWDKEEDPTDEEMNKMIIDLFDDEYDELLYSDSYMEMSAVEFRIKECDCSCKKNENGKY